MKYYIGVDIGHGETAVACYNVDTNQTTKIELVQDLSWTKAIYSAFYTDSNGNTKLIGKNEASGLVQENYSSFRQGFKKKVSEMSEDDRESMKTFVKALYDAIVNNPTVRLTPADDISFCVACPTEWSFEESYEYMCLMDEAGMFPSWIVGEAWAAYNKLKKPLSKEQRILVIDYGSSTIDYCAVDLTKKDKIVLQSSTPIGAHNVEKSVISDPRVLTHITQIRQGYGTDVNMSLLYFASRLVKEKFFSNIFRFPDFPYCLSVSGMHFSSPPADLEPKPFNWYADKSEHTPHLSSLPKYQDYIRKFKEFIVNLRNGLSEMDYSPDVILLSGSASQMDFVKNIIENTFGKEVVLDNEPEYVICDGIIEIAKNGDLRDVIDYYYSYLELVEQYKSDPEKFFSNMQKKPIPTAHEKQALGLCYLLGIGCIKSPKKAYAQFSENSDFCILMRAWMYITGTGVACNLDKARELLELIDSDHDGRQVLDQILKNNKPQEGLYETTFILNFCKDSLETGIGQLVSALIKETTNYSPNTYHYARQ